jgi:uncharacterized protein (TIGR02453 family)
MAFEGFSAGTLAFLRELADNNDKAWFDANRSRYESELLDREKAFVSAMGERMRAVVPGLEAVPRVNGSIFRINRDTRFSKDKTPYKTHADMWMWEGSDRKASSGLFVRIVPDEIWIGAGAHMLSKEGLQRVRDAIVADPGVELVSVMADLEGAGYEFSEPTLKRTPRGYLIDHPRADLLRLTSVAAMRSEGVPDEFFSADFVEWCAVRYEELLPLHRWMVSVLEG